MTLDTSVPAARRHVEEEREAVSAKLTAYDAFVQRIEAVGVDRGGEASTASQGGTMLATATRSAGGCAAVREAFEATVCSVTDDGSTVETMAAELGDDVAVALAPTTGSAFTPSFRAQVVDAADARRWQLRTMATALEREAAQLDAAAETFDALRGWLDETDRTPLKVLGFDALRRRHDRLDDHLAACETQARERQTFLDGSTSEHARMGLGHRHLVSYLYVELPVDYPILSGVASAVSLCRRCQRNVRAHLTRCG